MFLLSSPGTFLSCLGSCFSAIPLLSLVEVGMASHQLQSVSEPLALYSIPFSLLYLGYPCPGYHLSVSQWYMVLTQPLPSRHVIAKTSKVLFHWQGLCTFHWNLRESLLPWVLQNRLLWLSWFLVTCRAATTWVCVGILSTETLLPCWRAVLCMSNALALDQPHLITQCLLLRQHPPGSHILCHIFSWKIDELHKRLSAKLYSPNKSRATVLYYKSNLK